MPEGVLMTGLEDGRTPGDLMLSTPNRRSVLKALGGAAALMAAPGPLRSQNRSEVVVIGAGLSGLAAALLLEQSGVNVRVVEGRRRIGGRVYSTRELPGAPEMGGTGFAHGYARLLDAAQTHGVELVDLKPVLGHLLRREIFLGGEHIPIQQWPEHPRNPFPADSREIPPWAYLGQLTARANPLKSLDGWLAPENRGLDIAYHDWLRQQGVSEDIIRVTSDVEQSHGNTAFNVSALMMLFVATFFTTQRELARPGESPFLLSKGGNQSIPEAMARALQNEVELGRRVVAIHDVGDHVEVIFDDGRVHKADRVVCSVPCPVLRRISIWPPLPTPQARAIQTLDSQAISLIHMVTKTPFWEEEGLSPNMFSDGLVSNLVGERHGSSPDEVTSLTAWVRGNKAAFLDQLPEAEARAAVLEDLAERRPSSRGKLEIVAYKSWYRDPFAAGGWAIWKPGQVSTLAPHVGTAHGRIHFCGEHTAQVSRGMEGAMESGERVAVEVLGQM
jgi:monoamine oxidase